MRSEGHQGHSDSRTQGVTWSQIHSFSWRSSSDGEQFLWLPEQVVKSSERASAGQAGVSAYKCLSFSLTSTPRLYHLQWVSSVKWEEVDDTSRGAAMAHSLGTQGNEFPMPACVVSREDGVSSALIWCTLKTVSQLEKKKKKVLLSSSAWILIFKPFFLLLILEVLLFFGRRMVWKSSIVSKNKRVDLFQGLQHI